MAGTYGSIRAYRDDPDFRDARDESPASSVSQVTEKIRSNIFSINNGANAVDRAMKSIGTERDNPQLRDKIHETSQKTAKIVQETTKLLRAAATKKADKQQKIQLDLLKSNFQEAVQRFQSLQKKAAAKVKSAVKLGSKPTSEPLVAIASDDDRSPLVLEEELQQNQMLKEQEAVIEDDLALIREREERIHQLESDILDVNEIFRELGAMVHTQGEVLDTIDNNVEQASANVESGNEQLVQAAEYQRKSRRKMCCLLVIFLVVIAVVAIIVVVSLKS
ncbi:syntaxin-7-like isoform x2 [Plakobranchus ocellatus]|uniref:Syntaxin-7-like isoform x2 n=1 Tax=Plakobranchus ocellatus TaxID=259542 RepID=A0AAV4E2L9_9GAST|nr:syntaxin-7-like isoform x2 [Plakobranchus ocellatus]